MQANEKFARQCHIVSFTFWTVIFGQHQWSKHQLFSQIQVCHNYALCCPHFDLDLAQTNMTGLRHICLAGDDLNSAKQNSVLNPLVMAQVPSVKSSLLEMLESWGSEEAAATGRRWQAAAIEAVEQERAGACFGYQKRLASTVERDGERLNSVAKSLIIYSGSAARCILSKC